MFDYVLLYKGAECAEVKFIFDREEPKRIASIIEEMIDDDITMDGSIWEQIFPLCFENKSLYFDSAVLETSYTATTVTFYFDYLDYPPEEIIEQAEEFQDMITDMIEDENEMISFIEDYAGDIMWG